METIYAPATAPGRAGVAVIRVSGPAAFALRDKLAGGAVSGDRPRLRSLRDGDGVALDQALVLSFAGPGSFTGEDIVEFQTHGSPAIVKAVLTAIGETGLARPAEAGEFTRRALMNNRLDLAQIEGLGALIEAETEAQRRLALRVFSGKLGELVESWRRDLIRAAALTEATIDFADEDVPVDVGPEVEGLLSGVIGAMQAEIAGSLVAERVRDGFEVAILGAPNAGKSTLLNALAGREAAITSEVAGTTRDVIEVRMDLGGLAVTLLDTAGLRETGDIVENLGIDRARARAARADLRVFLQSQPDEAPLVPLEGDDLIVLGKADLYPGAPGAVSGLTGAGVADLIERITGILAGRAAGALLATHARHRVAMQGAVASLDAGRLALQGLSETPELTAEHIRDALRKLDSLIGRVDVEAVLGEIFASFCIGK